MIGEIGAEYNMGLTRALPGGEGNRGTGERVRGQGEGEREEGFHFGREEVESAQSFLYHASFRACELPLLCVPRRLSSYHDSQFARNAR